MDWIQFAKETRTTQFFRDYAIAEIKVAYRIMEYLSPDETFKSIIDNATMTLIENKHFREALTRIINYEIDCDIDSSHWSQELHKNGLELMEYLFKKWQQNKRNQKEIKRQQLIKQLEELDKQD